MSRDKTQMPAFFDAETRYDLSKDDLVQLIRAHTGLPDGVVEFDVSNKGQLRGASIRIRRVEIKG